MGYMHITPLYKLPDFFELFKEVYAMEKIHGTSTWVTYDISAPELKYHSGGEKLEKFKALFNHGSLQNDLTKLAIENNWSIIRIHGECYGNKQQKMSKIYGNKLKFIAFDIYITKINNITNNDKQSYFLDVPDAEKISKLLGLEFVDYVKGPNTPDWIEEQSKMQSIQAIRNGIGPGKSREGVVIRPLIESLFTDGKRAIAKHKNSEFSEITSKRPLGEHLKILDDAQDIVNEWVTEERFNHVADRILQKKDDKKIGLGDIKTFIELMIEDVKREADGEIIWSNSVDKRIRQKTGLMFRDKIKNLIFSN